MSGRDRLADFQSHSSQNVNSQGHNQQNQQQGHSQQEEYGQDYNHQGQYDNQDYNQHGQYDNQNYNQHGQYDNQNDNQYYQQYDSGNQYDQSGQYSQDYNQYNQQDQYNHDGHYAQNGQYGESGPYDQQSPYDHQRQYSQQDQYGHQSGHDQYAQHQEFAQQQQTQYQGQNDTSTHIKMNDVPATATDDMSVFFAEVTSIQDDISKLEQNIVKIEELRETSLNNVSTEEQATISTRQIESITADTSQLSNRIKKRVKDIELANLRLASSPNIQIRKTQAANLKDKFVTTLRHYQTAESEARKKYQVRMERQYKIVNPNATQEEVEEALEGDNQQIFAQSVLQSTRYGEANRALREVQSRHNDIKKIEKTILELHQLFMDMETLVTEQGEVIETVEQELGQVDAHLEQANVQVDNAIANARSARKKKWICLILTIVIIAIIVIIVLAATKSF